jgi:geranylgeranyl diphosphate synthase type II
MMPAALAGYFKKHLPAVEKNLIRLLPRVSASPRVIHEAMRYSVLNGGKRLRPILVIAGAEICGGRAHDAMPFACALEFIHAYSLIHDDLPAMDDDDLRRGKPTNHKVYGEDIAILAGDALLTRAFESMAASPLAIKQPARAIKAIQFIAAEAGTAGMVGGQVADIQADQGRWKNMTTDEFKSPASLLEFIHLKKTGALIRASLVSGGIVAGASGSQLKALDEYGRSIGLLFQITDDILDVVGDKKKLGKRGSDGDNDKLTYVSLHGVDKSRREAEKLLEKSRRSLKSFEKKSQMLDSLARYILSRDH